MSGKGSDAFSNGLIELKFDILNHCSLKIRKFSNFWKFRNTGWITCVTTDIFIWRPNDIIVKIDRFLLMLHLITWYSKLIEASYNHSVRYELRFYLSSEKSIGRWKWFRSCPSKIRPIYWLWLVSNFISEKMKKIFGYFCTSKSG